MRSSGLLKFESIQYWMRSLRTEGNRRKCRNAFPPFMRWVRERGIAEDPDEIIASRIEDLKRPLDDPKRYRWEDLAKEFYHKDYDRLLEEGGSSWTARTRLSAIQSFFSHHRLDLKFRKGELKVATAKREKRVPTLDEIRALFESAESFRDKALVLTLSQTGMSEVDVCELDVEDVVDELAKPPIYYDSARKKTRHKGARIQTCIGPEASEQIALYLKKRGNPREGPLFVAGTKGGGQRVSTRTVRLAIKRLAEVAEVNYDFQVKDLRDFYGDALDRAGISGKVKELMMGRIPPGAERFYKTSKYTIQEAYIKAYRYLKINSMPRPKERDKEIASEFIYMLRRIAGSEDPRVEAAKLITEYEGVSPDLIGPTSFKALLKYALEEE